MAKFLAKVKGFWENVLEEAQVVQFTPNVTHLGADMAEFDWSDQAIAAKVSGALGIVQGMTPADMYRAQPSIRNVLSFFGRNIAQVRVHVYETVSENDRQRRRESVAAKLLRRPNPRMTGYQLIYALVVDRKLYDRAYWLITRVDGEPQLWRIPPTWMKRVDKNMFEVEHYLLKVKGGRQIKVSPQDVIEFGGYDPSRTSGSSPAIDALRDILAEQVAATVYRAQVWQNGGRVSGYISRPVDAPTWSPEASERFEREFREKYAGNHAPGAGSMPVLEEGMAINRLDFNATEQQWVEGIKLGLSLVAATYHINPTMVGLLDNANYSNVREFRKMLYGDTLGPDFEDIQEVFNSQLLPRLGEANLYAEFNIAAKLQGNFEEQAQYLQSATGGAYMTRNEARSRLNLPAIDGADELVVPLNVLEGGQASPTDSDPNKALPGRVQTKAGASGKARSQYRDALKRFFETQRSVVLSRMGAKAVWWDQARWNKDLAEALLALHLATSTQAALKVIRSAGLDSSEFSEEQTLHYWETVARAQARRINKSTKEQLDKAADPETDLDPKHVFDIAEGSRAAMLAVGMATSAAAWGSLEAGKQTGASTKTWVTTSTNPRSAHARMNGQTVKLSENFSNGMAWPGDGANGDADDLAGCKCELVINYEER